MRREGLNPKEEFGTRLYQAQVFEKEPQGTIERDSISDSDYEHYKKVMKAFKCETFGDLTTPNTFTIFTTTILLLRKKLLLTMLKSYPQT